MRNRILALGLLCMVLALSAFAITADSSDADTSPSSGSGTYADPYVFELTKGTSATITLSAYPATVFIAANSDVTIPGMTFQFGTWSGSTLSMSGVSTVTSATMTISGTPTSAGSWMFAKGWSGYNTFYTIHVTAPSTTVTKTWTFYDTDASTFLKRITVSTSSSSVTVTMPSLTSTITGTAIETWTGIDWWLCGKYYPGTGLTVAASDLKDTSFYAYKTAYASATGVSITGSDSLVKVGGTLSLSATVSPSNANQRVTWSSSDTSIATVSSSGTVTGVGPGHAVITAKAKSDTSIRDTYSVDVVSVSLSCPTYCVVGERLCASASANTGSITWSVSDSSKVSVSGSTITVTSTGTFTVTATESSSGATASVTVTAYSKLCFLDPTNGVIVKC